MYVKIVPRDPLAGAHIFEGPAAADSITYGDHWSDDSPKDRDYDEDLRLSVGYAHIFGVDDEPITQGGEARWHYRYAWWFDSDRGIVLVVTSGDLYILSNTGATIDRVR